MQTLTFYSEAVLPLAALAGVVMMLRCTLVTLGPGWAGGRWQLAGMAGLAGAAFALATLAPGLPPLALGVAAGLLAALGRNRLAPMRPVPQCLALGAGFAAAAGTVWVGLFGAAAILTLAASGAILRLCRRGGEEVAG